ncbi:hypothetical protein Pan181_28910 [Aeoliella mucimassa]|uniref:Uncharacterized protein n=1 Tax=Aeoliella mucimassa TaxID=2527972 RepID=A0A518APP6_9BACT|nr:hypothetical protein Pan181_28910 [Aeoliella mucimassa]
MSLSASALSDQVTEQGELLLADGEVSGIPLVYEVEDVQARGTE